MRKWLIPTLTVLMMLALALPTFAGDKADKKKDRTAKKAARVKMKADKARKTAAKVKVKADKAGKTAARGKAKAAKAQRMRRKNRDLMAEEPMRQWERMGRRMDKRPRAMRERRHEKLRRIGMLRERSGPDRRAKLRQMGMLRERSGPERQAKLRGMGMLRGGERRMMMDGPPRRMDARRKAMDKPAAKLKRHKKRKDRSNRYQDARKHKYGMREME